MTNYSESWNHSVISLTFLTVALLSLREKKCVMTASRHIFPIHVIKWRPLDDFMIVGSTDGSVYVWQMETGHLDRVVQGMTADEILSACDEHSIQTTEDKLSNPAIHLLRGMRHRNMAAIKHAAVRGITHLVGPQHQEQREVIDMSIQSRSHPLMIQGLKANPKDQNCHVLFFDLESMIVNLLSEEYALLSPNSLESQGLTNNSEYQKFVSMSCSPDQQGKLTRLFANVRENAGTAASKIQSGANKVGFKPASAEVNLSRKPSNASDSADKTAIPSKQQKVQFGETKLTMEIAQLILSLLHAWGLDLDLDRVCESKLGLVRPSRPVCFGILAKNGYMSLLLPMRIAETEEAAKQEDKQKATNGKQVRISDQDVDQEIEKHRAEKFAARIHWELSTAITTAHLLSIISLANTLMSMSSATFIAEQERKRRLVRRLSRAETRGEIELCEGLKGLDSESIAYEQQQIKQGWSLLAALHCVILPDLLKNTAFRRPLPEVLARRWQDRCLEIRGAAQALLLAELRRMGSKGRKQLVDEWFPFLPQQINESAAHAMSARVDQVYGQPAPGHAVVSNPSTTVNSEASSLRDPRPAGTNEDAAINDSDDDVEDFDDMGSEFGTAGSAGADASRRTSATSHEDKRKQR
jgi:hypothetical protein